MNKFLRNLIVIYCAILMFILLIVPWKMNYGGLNVEKGYGFIFSRHNPFYTIDIARLLIEIAVITIIVVLVYVLSDAAGDWSIIFIEQVSCLIRYTKKQEAKIRKSVKIILFVLFATTVFITYINTKQNQSAHVTTQLITKAEVLGGNAPAKSSAPTLSISTPSHSFSNYSKHIPPILSTEWIKLGAQSISKNNIESLYYAPGSVVDKVGNKLAWVKLHYRYPLRVKEIFTTANAATNMINGYELYVAVNCTQSTLTLLYETIYIGNGSVYRHKALHPFSQHIYSSSVYYPLLARACVR